MSRSLGASALIAGILLIVHLHLYILICICVAYMIDVQYMQCIHRRRTKKTLWQLCIYGTNALADTAVFASQSKQWNLSHSFEKTGKFEHRRVARIVNLVISLSRQSTDGIRWPCAILNNPYIEIYL
jgi:hypothetical protein